MQSLSLKTDKPLDPNVFMPWLQNLVQVEGGKILRSKGILAFHDDDDRYVFQGVHMLFDAKFDREWGPDPRTNTLVFIGKNLDREALNRGFVNCLA